MDQYIRTNDYKNKSCTCNEWMNIKEQINIKIEILAAMNESVHKNKNYKDKSCICNEWMNIKKQIKIKIEILAAMNESIQINK